MRIVFSKNAWEDYISWQKEDKKVLQKITKLIKEIETKKYISLHADTGTKKIILILLYEKFKHKIIYNTFGIIYIN